MKIAKIYPLIVILILSQSVFSQVGNCQQYKKATQTYTLYNSPENHRSDTIDILKYTINLDITDFAGQTIKGNTVVRFAPKLAAQSRLRLDLLKLTVDSVKSNNSILTYTYNDTLLKVNLPLAMNTTDTADVTVYYHGHPQGDPSNWGGFSFSGTYAYNLGVGFGANPHCYGRVWFPCFDNFVEKSRFEFNIISDTSKSAYCNGQLMGDVVSGSKRTRTWIMNKEICSYLASVAVADYKPVHMSISAANGPLPVLLAGRAVDTTAMKNGFVHLPNAVLGFENYYGPYVWNRVGYALVPFSSGAMEHATNIAYPQATVGNLTYESELMAHELSHHWWGDLMTCETQEDMWLNEGMASYSQRLFYEWTYNYQKYLDDVKTNHEDIIKYIHLREGGFRAISGIPHDYTYGDHVYKKGADVAHTLRSYMGDAAFFAGLKYVIQQKSYKNMNSLEFRDLLQTSSGQNLTDFFNNWVLAGGWPHFSIDSVRSTGTAAPYTSVVYVKQKLFGAPALYSNVPLEVTFMNSQWAKEIKTVVMTGALKSFTVQTNVQPAFVGMNVDSKISDAISSDYKTIKTNATLNYTMARALVIVSNYGADSSYVRIEHNLAAPDPIKNNTGNYRIDSQHYWKVAGLLSNGFVAKIRLNYDGNKNTSGVSYLDTCLINANADSLILLYRKNAADDWKEVPHYTRYHITAKTGFFTADTLKMGEYVFANGKSNVLAGVKEQAKEDGIKIFPNPAHDDVLIEFSAPVKTAMHAELRDLSGRLVQSKAGLVQQNTMSLKELQKGVYIISIIDQDQKVRHSQKIIIQ